MEGVTRYRVTETFTTPLLGTSPANKDVYKDFIAKKKKEAEEKRAAFAERRGIDAQAAVGTVEEEVDTIVKEESGLTVFHNDFGQKTDDGKPGQGLLLFDYMVCGYWKETAEALQELHGIKQPRSKIDNFVFVHPRRVYITDDQGKVLTQCDDRYERPLRCMTMMGPRVSLTCSELIQPGRKIQYEIEFLPMLKSGSGKEAKRIDVDKFVEMILTHGTRKGRCQWRSGGWGRFSAKWEKLP